MMSKLQLMLLPNPINFGKGNHFQILAVGEHEEVGMQSRPYSFSISLSWISHHLFQGLEMPSWRSVAKKVQGDFCV